MKAEEAVQEWRRGLGFGSLRARIFAVNLLAVIVLAIMLLYLDTVRSRLLDERTASLANEAITVSRLVTDLPPTARPGSILRLGMERGTRVRLYAGSGERLADNWLNPKTPRFVIEDPAAYGWRRSSAKAIDRALDAVLGFRTLSPYVEPAVDTASLWPELARSSTAAQPITDLRRANDGSLIVTAAAPVPGVGHVLLTDSADDLASILRRERLTSAWLLLSVMALTLGLSLYLARTIVRPLRMLGTGCGWGAAAKWWCRACPTAVTRLAPWPAPFPICPPHCGARLTRPRPLPPMWRTNSRTRWLPCAPPWKCWTGWKSPICARNCWR